MLPQIPAFLALVSALATALLLVNDGPFIPMISALLTAGLLAVCLLRGLQFLKPRPEAAPLQQDQTELHAAQQRIMQLTEELQAVRKVAKEPISQGELSTYIEAGAVLLFLRVLHEKSRILDFSMTDISRLPDHQIGAAARLVHQGIRDVLNESFKIAPIAAEAEGQFIQLAEDFDRNRYRLVKQKAQLTAPSGILLHRGWEALALNLPRSTRQPGEPPSMTLAPAEIESREEIY